VNAATFARHRARIEREHHGRGRKYRKALAHLITDARAALVVMQRKVVGYRLPNGEMVCIKTRYRSWDEATADVMRIQGLHTDGDRVPVRAYSCAHCRGFHTTSQARLSAQQPD
jgi:hypothetical protein